MRFFSLIIFIVLLQLPAICFSQQSGNVQSNSDSIAKSVFRPTKNLRSMDQIVGANYLIDSKSPSIDLSQPEHFNKSTQTLFYFIAGLFLFLGLLKVAFNRYFNNMIRVFFNTSLRQSQLTDQLLLAKLPSLLFNILFVIVAGVYVFLLINGFKSLEENYWQSLLYSILAITTIYLVKYFVLQLSGWLTGYMQNAENYIFIVFLSNKVLTLLLLPVILVVAFADNDVSYITRILSYVIISIMILLRYIRAFGVINLNLIVTKFHFFLYIIGVELLPVFLVYKTLVVFLNKSL